MSDIPKAVNAEVPTQFFSKDMAKPQYELAPIIDKFVEWSRQMGAAPGSVLPPEVRDEMLSQAQRFEGWMFKGGKPPGQGGFTGDEAVAYHDLSAKFKAWEEAWGGTSKEPVSESDKAARLEALKTDLQKWEEKWGGGPQQETPK